MNAAPRVLARTQSVCPECLRQVDALRVAEGDEVYLTKTCPEHGAFKTVVWRGLASYERWGARGSRAAQPPVFETEVKHGCPHDCGLCPDHRQQSCCVLLEVTQRCDLRCPVCFASAGREGSDPSLGDLEASLRALRTHGSQVNLQLSGGEPTVRDDLPDIVALARSLGFDFVQLNTNGVRVAKETGYAQRLADAGLDCVFLQFDGVSDETYRRIRGARLFTLKKAAIRECAEAGLGVVLVPTLVPGVNVAEIGAIVEFAAARVPTVRAVHFQPISYFGRYPTAPSDSARITLPEVMAELEAQTLGMIRAADFNPGSAENAYCSFSGKFNVGANGRLRASVPVAAGCCDTGAASACGCGAPAADSAPRARRLVAKQWAAPSPDAVAPDAPDASTAPVSVQSINISSMEAFLATRRHAISISGMAFQDAWTLDIERLRECFIHVVSPDRRIIPFCAYNLTAMSGASLYRQSTCECV